MPSRIRSIIILSFVSIVFFAIYSFPYWKTAEFSKEYENGHIIFNSPDETAGFFFLMSFIRDNTLRVEEPLNAESGNIVHPRSVNVVTDSAKGRFYLVPTHFLGFFYLYGALGMIFPSEAVLFFTPFLAAFSSIGIFFLWKPIFGEKISFISAFLLLIHPAYWYYASRGLLSNVLFVDLLIIAFAVLLHAFSQHQGRNTKSLFSMLSGIAFSLALIVRPSELVWVTIVLVFLGIMHIKRLTLGALLLLVLPMVISFSLFFLWNTKVYGNPLATGYDTSESLLLSSEEFFWVTRFDVVNFPWRNVVAKLFFPFGFHLLSAWKHFQDYFFDFFSLFTFLAIVGLLLSFLKLDTAGSERRRMIFHYLLASVIVSVVLIPMYGSFEVYDNIAGNGATIGVSYVRYWLPIFILTLPFIAKSLFEIVMWMKGTTSRFSVLVMLGIIVIATAVYQTYLEDNEGLSAVNANVERYYRVEQRVEKILPADAVLITDRADKIFWPKKKVISYLGNDEVFPGVKGLIAEGATVYYYLHTELSGDIMERLNSKVLPALGLEIVVEKKFEEGDYLYEVKEK
jgi:hypothetical protein